MTTFDPFPGEVQIVGPVGVVELKTLELVCAGQVRLARRVQPAEGGDDRPRGEGLAVRRPDLPAIGSPDGRGDRGVERDLVVDTDLPTFVHEHPHRGRTDTGGAAGDDGDSVVQPSGCLWHCCSPLEQAATLVVPRELGEWRGGRRVCQGGYVASLDFGPVSLGTTSRARRSTIGPIISGSTPGGRPDEAMSVIP